MAHDTCLTQVGIGPYLKLMRETTHNKKTKTLPSENSRLAVWQNKKAIEYVLLLLTLLASIIAISEMVH